MKKPTLINLLQKESIIKYGAFTLRSGKKSTYYCDIKQAVGNVKILRSIVSELTLLVPKETTCIAGSGYGGIALAALVAQKRKLPLVLVRDRIKDHGTQQAIEAYVPNNKDRVCIVDDVFTTGSSVRDTKEKLSITQCKFVSAVVVLNRSKNSKVISLITDKEILQKNTL